MPCACVRSSRSASLTSASGVGWRGSVIVRLSFGSLWQAVGARGPRGLREARSGGAPPPTSGAAQEAGRAARNKGGGGAGMRFAAAVSTQEGVAGGRELIESVAPALEGRADLALLFLTGPLRDAAA